ncbi:hypothetical protein GS429_05885 [Natronorubrum sp. JWXQ-INN-674]|uniref:Halobacterial output domain-containing protein n=2 Tax=Natrialbaceae TaxID=1644061 RepID=A0A4S3TIS3_9EURY|nr:MULTISPECIES: HalOD1 output domain-containing protein [Natrialbaceae]MXV61602.1 hypothetical protein [Natronorubrum halalkaliphilum]THE63113.1 hypothetical protein D8Y22_19995 [Salinadaptatus halalkaliphilus]
MKYQIDSDESTAIAVVQAVADHKGVHHEELEPIYESVEPDALDSLVGNGSDVVVQFEYAGEVVTVDSSRICLEDREYMERACEGN